VAVDLLDLFHQWWPVSIQIHSNSGIFESHIRTVKQVLRHAAVGTHCNTVENNSFLSNLKIFELLCAGDTQGVVDTL
jgi:hypothetical protein